MNWPVLDTPHSASVFWGWAQIVLAILNFLVIGQLFFWDGISTFRQGDVRGAVFGWCMAAVSVTTSVHGALRGFYTVDMRLTPTGIKPLDIGSLIMRFIPMIMFAVIRARAWMHKPDWVTRGTPPWMLMAVIVSSAYGGAFVQRFIDGVRFNHIHLHFSRFDSYYNLILAVAYFACAALWLRFQVKMKIATQTWNVGGLSLGFIFLTIGFQRLAQAIEMAANQYVIRASYESLYEWVDVLSIAATLFLLGYSASLLASSGSRNSGGAPATTT